MPRDTRLNPGDHGRAMDRPTAIRQSLTAFGCGLAAMIPILGMIPAVLALFCWGRISLRYKDDWNPAAAYLSVGAFFGSLGFLLSLLLIAAALISLP